MDFVFLIIPKFKILGVIRWNLILYPIIFIGFGRDILSFITWSITKVSWVMLLSLRAEFSPKYQFFIFFSSSPFAINSIWEYFSVPSLISSGFWLHYSDYNTFKNIVVNDTACSLFLWGSKYNFFENNILPSITLERYSDHNVFIKNHLWPSFAIPISIQLETSDFNIFKCNNIYGHNIIVGALLKKNKSTQIYNSRFTKWDRNYWGDCFRENHNLLTKFFPKIIIGLFRSIYVPHNKINFPGVINFDWHPANEAYEII